MFLLSSFAEEHKPTAIKMISSVIRRDHVDMAKHCPKDWDIICTFHVFFRTLVEFKNRCIFDVFSSGPVHEWNGRTK